MGEFMRASKLVAIVLGFAISLASAHQTLAGEIRNLSISRSSTEIGKPTNLIVEYDIDTALTIDQFLFRMHISDAFSAPTASTNIVTTPEEMSVEINGVPYTGAAYVMAVRRYTNTIQFDVRLTTAIPAGTRVKLTVDDSILSNSNTPGTYTFHRIETAGGAGHTIDSYNGIVQLNTYAPAIPTLGEWSLIIMGTALVGAAGLTIARRRRMLAA